MAVLLIIIISFISLGKHYGFLRNVLQVVRDAVEWDLFSVYLCVLFICMWVWMHLYIHVNTHVYAHMGMTEHSLGCHSSVNINILWVYWDRVIHWCGSHPVDLDDKPGSPQGFTCLCLCSARILNTCPPVTLAFFHVGNGVWNGVWTLVLLLRMQAFLPTETSLQLPFLCF